jgi:hypothetical protein
MKLFNQIAKCIVKYIAGRNKSDATILPTTPAISKYLFIILFIKKPLLMIR